MRFVTTLFEDGKHPGKVTVAFMMAVNAARKQLPSTVVLMLDGVRLGVPGGLHGIAAPPPFKPAQELEEELLALGGQVVVCATCLQAAGLRPEELDPRLRVVTGPEVVDLLTGAQGTFQVT